MTAIEEARAAVNSATVARRYGVHPDAGWLERALRALIAEHEALLREMHQRELHHFETEKALTEAGIDPDDLPDAVDGVRALVEGVTGERS